MLLLLRWWLHLLLLRRLGRLHLLLLLRRPWGRLHLTLLSSLLSRRWGWRLHLELL